MSTGRRILVIGAGIGGLSAAIALRQAGVQVKIFERAASLKEVGAGIGLSANATRVLKQLGVMDAVVARGQVLEAAQSYNWTGERLGRMSMNLSDVPSLCLHRADLHQVLLSAVPPDCLHLGQEFLGLEQASDTVTARFASGLTEAGDALVGADGLRSRVRLELLGDGKPVYRGYQCWRGVCDYPANDVLTETFGQGVRVGLVPLGARGTAWWFTANEPEKAEDGPEGASAKLAGWVRNWHAPIPEVIDRTDPQSILKTGIYDRSPTKRWSHGLCTLLGDAAHPATPNMGQGGCMAIEDAVVLARCLSSGTDTRKALSVYQGIRAGRTARVIQLSRYYGMMGQWENPIAAMVRAALLRRSCGKFAVNGYLRFVNYDPCKVALS